MFGGSGSHSADQAGGAFQWLHASKAFEHFELVKLGDTGLDAQVIQKLMSAPVVVGNGQVVGVIQVSRKAPRPAAGGTGLYSRRSAELESVARVVGTLMANGKHRHCAH
jgi:hypothetical protein